MTSLACGNYCFSKLASQPHTFTYSISNACATYYRCSASTGGSVDLLIAMYNIIMVSSSLLKLFKNPMQRLVIMPEGKSF